MAYKKERSVKIVTKTHTPDDYGPKLTSHTIGMKDFHKAFKDNFGPELKDPPRGVRIVTVGKDDQVISTEYFGDNPRIVVNERYIGGYDPYDVNSEGSSIGGNVSVNLAKVIETQKYMKELAAKSLGIAKENAEVDRKAVNKFYDIVMEKLKRLSLTYLHKEYEK